MDRRNMLRFWRPVHLRERLLFSVSCLNCMSVSTAVERRFLTKYRVAVVLLVDHQLHLAQSQDLHLPAQFPDPHLPAPRLGAAHQLVALLRIQRLILLRLLLIHSLLTPVLLPPAAGPGL